MSVGSTGNHASQTTQDDYEDSYNKKDPHGF